MPTFVVDTSRSPRARLRPVPADAVRLEDAFLEPRRRRNREATLASQFGHLEKTGTLDNFRRAAGTKACDFRGPVFMDSDAYKWLEAAASSLGTDPDPALAAMVEELAGLIAGAQQPDGYLNTAFTKGRENERYENLRDWHEMYCAGHFLQAAVAHHRATGSDALLGVARRLADHLDATFGEGEGKRAGTCGHPEIEMALVELYRETGEARYLALARYLVDARGQEPTAAYRRTAAGGWFDRRYLQDHVPYRDLDEVTGHAVRMLYLAAGAADLWLEQGDEGLWAAQMRQWDSFTTRRMYVSGAAGARHDGEAFGKDYELPNARAYAETCAAIASVMWNHRLLLATGEARYADLVEWTLYNAVLPGLSLDGESYFYENPLEDDGAHRRQPWFGCACCPPNVARLLSQLPGYVYGVSDEGVWMHLYAEGAATLTLPGGGTVALTTRTRYPWDGEIEITVDEASGAGEFSLFLRVPDWVEAGGAAGLAVNGEAARATDLTPGSYAEVRRAWAAGDRVTLSLPMPVRLLEAHPYATDCAGRLALARGPLLYCAEDVDHPGVSVRDLVLPADFAAEPTWRADLLGGGVVALTGTARVSPPAADGWQGGALYRPRRAPVVAAPAAATLTAIPYYAWANREPGAMAVWLRAANG